MMRHRHPFVKAIVDRLAEPCGVGAGDRLLLAVSGGADSVALLRALAAAGPRQPWSLDLHVGHVNHQVREAASGDAAFVEAMAGELGMPFHGREVTAAPTEDALRDARYAALTEVARSIDADAIVTAHHADDQLETMLMRLIRGAAASGLSGIDPRPRLLAHDVPIIRPMLAVTHAEAVAFCESCDQPWREDHTNAQRDRWRNVIRHDCLPALRSLRPDAAKKAAEAADAIRDLGDALDWMIDRIDTTDRAELAELPGALLGGVIRKRGIDAGVPADRLGGETLRPILAAIRDGRGGTRTFDLAGGVILRVNPESVRVDQATKNEGHEDES